MVFLRRPSLLLEVDLTQPLSTPDATDPLDRLRSRGRPRLSSVLRTLHEAGSDPHVAGLVVKVGGALPWPVMQELRLGVSAFAASGKPAVAWAEAFGEGRGEMGTYVLATAFEEIWLQPGGGVGMLGVAVETTFLRDALDRLGVEAQVEQRHEYKNAPDTLLRTAYTSAHREALEALTASVSNDAVEAVATGRRLDQDRVRELVDTGPRTAAEALAVGLVDRLGYRDEVYAAVRARAGEGAELLFADRWSPRCRLASRLFRPGRAKGHVALVEIRGGITSGRNRRGPTGRQVGSDTIAGALRAVVADADAKALLLHVDSPGGSAVASEVIWREVARVRDSGRPVVVSMGATAASGGYYVACPADVIVALPSTLTGSIGVFGGKVVLAQLLERVGVTTGTVEQGDRSRMFSSRRGFSEPERQRLAVTIDAIYDDFVQKVADGRHRAYDEVEPLARGRVWTGRDALERGLVDELGGRRDALRIARQRAGLPDDAPLRPAVQVPLPRRLRRPRNSEDPRAAVAAAGWPGLDALASALDLSPQWALRMPRITVR